MCDYCWRNREGDRVPHRLAEGERVRTQCPICGFWTESGIYVRIETKDTK